MTCIRDDAISLLGQCYQERIQTFEPGVRLGRVAGGRTIQTTHRSEEWRNYKIDDFGG